jgi:hypothetical protein
METQVIKVKNLGGRPPKITQDMIWEIIRIKGEYGIGEWKRTINLAKELHPDWSLPNYKNCLSGVYRTFEMMVDSIQLILFLNRIEFVKKTLK